MTGNSTVKTKLSIALIGSLLIQGLALAGGGGANMLLVVDSNDETAVRIATQYQKTRGIPDGNIVFIGTPNLTGTSIPHRIISQTTSNNYLTTVANAINSRGLSGQIDYIGLIGTPQVVIYNTSSGGTATQSLAYQFSQMTQLLGGVTSDKMSNFASPLYQTGLAVNTNTAIHHDDVYQATYAGRAVNAQYYLSGVIGYCGQWGNTAEQVIANLKYTADGDGAQLPGAVYFEENGDIRCAVRKPQWAAVQAALTERGLDYVQEWGTTPAGRDDIKGAVIGVMNYSANGSTYLPGSWADSVTSFGGDFGSARQTKATTLLAAGAAGSSGTIAEPGAVAAKFPNAAIHVFLADGSTIGEAFYKSTAQPYLQFPIGDLLSQADADLPRIALDDAPAGGQTVSGTLSIQANASLENPRIASGIDHLKLLVDGKEMQTMAGASASFSLDTAALSDGRHELRVVAVNNAAAQSQSETTWSVTVNNRGQSVRALSGDLIAADQQTLSVAVAADAGAGSAVDHIELRHLGRVMGTLAASGGAISVEAAKLAYGDNPIVPVAVLADGREVAGESFSITRTPTYVAGVQDVSGANTPGVKVEYFAGKGASKIAKSDFSGTPTQTVIVTDSLLKNAASSVQDYGLPGVIQSHPSDIGIDRLAIRMTGLFEVAEMGEYSFILNKTNDSAQLTVSGQTILAYDNQLAGLSDYGNCIGSLFLAAGLHEFELLTSNLVTGTDPASVRNCYDIALLYQGPDGLWRTFNTENTTSVPEPTCLSILMATSVLLGIRPRKHGGEPGHTA
jgi:hypothetical protein